MKQNFWSFTLNLSKEISTEISIFCMTWVCTEMSYLEKISAQGPVCTPICYSLSIYDACNCSTNCYGIKIKHIHFQKAVSLWVKSSCFFNHIPNPYELFRKCFTNDCLYVMNSSVRMLNLLPDIVHRTLMTKNSLPFSLSERHKLNIQHSSSFPCFN